MKHKFLILLCFFFSSAYSLDKFAVITPERSGTHLLTRALTLITGKSPLNVWERTVTSDQLHLYLDKVEEQGKYFQMHAYAQSHIMEILRQRGYKVIFLLRDPRDQLISVLGYMLERGWQYNKVLNTSGAPFTYLSYEEQIEEMITGDKYGYQVPHEFVIRRLGWAINDTPETYTTHFEKLVGENGGSTKEIQVSELKRLSLFVGVTLDNEKLDHIADILFGWPGLGTFRQGQIGSWKEHFTESHKKLFKEHFGRLLIFLEYESDFNW